jgi:hypothetical protein
VRSTLPLGLQKKRRRALTGRQTRRAPHSVGPSGLNRYLSDPGAACALRAHLPLATLWTRLRRSDLVCAEVHACGVPAWSAHVHACGVPTWSTHVHACAVPAWSTHVHACGVPTWSTHVHACAVPASSRSPCLRRSGLVCACPCLRRSGLSAQVHAYGVPASSRRSTPAAFRPGLCMSMSAD